MPERTDEAPESIPVETAERLSETREIAPLLVGRDRLTFSAGRRSVHVELEPLIKAGEPALVPTLLYGIVLKLHDIDTSFRRALEMSAGAVARAEAMQKGGALDTLVPLFERLGIDLPAVFRDAAPPSVRKADGEGKAAG